MERTTHYPSDLARLVGHRLTHTLGRTPPENLLIRLFETLYFASFQTDEGRRILCTVNFVEADRTDDLHVPQDEADHWTHVRFEEPLPLDVRTLTKLARAADPDVASLTVSSGEDGELYILGMVDQEPRHGDHITLDTDSAARRPGLFQAAITGTGTIAVYQNNRLLGDLAQNTLVDTHCDVLWSGPVHQLLAGNLCEFLAEHCDELLPECGTVEPTEVERELLLRWLNALSRVLVNARHYRHGGGFVITPDSGFNNVHIKYRVHYDRLLHALAGLVRAHFLRVRAAEVMRRLTTAGPQPDISTDIAFLRDVYFELEQRKREVLGANRFIASLACVDGVVLLDTMLTVHGFGVELRVDNDLNDIYVAGDAQASPQRLRTTDLTQFGTRHRAIMRYCYQHAGALGFAVSQDGAIQAVTRIGDRLILWENINVQLAFKAANWTAAGQHHPSPVLRPLALRTETY